MSRALGNPLPIVAPRSGISLPHPTGPDLFCWHIRKGRPRRAYSLKAMGDLSESYSLWFKPPAGPLAVQLVQEVAAQAKDFGGPLFEPHVTLLGGISCDRDNALATSQQLANKLKVPTAPLHLPALLRYHPASESCITGTTLSVNLVCLLCACRNSASTSWTCLMVARSTGVCTSW